MKTLAVLLLAFSLNAADRSLPDDRRVTLEATYTNLIVAVSNYQRAHPRSQSLDWSHDRAPSNALPVAARTEWRALGITNLPCRARVDEYVGPAGSGWVLVLEATPVSQDDSNHFQAIFATGPESYKSMPWFESAPPRER